MYAKICLKDAAIAEIGGLPAELIGLATESLADLSWTDPNLGLQGFGYWPLIVLIPPYDPDCEQPGDLGETRIDSQARTITATRKVVALEPAQIAERQRMVALATLAATDAAMSRPYENLLSVIRTLQPELFDALPEFTRAIHARRLAARARLAAPHA